MGHVFLSLLCKESCSFKKTDDGLSQKYEVTQVNASSRSQDITELQLILALLLLTLL